MNPFPPPAKLPITHNYPMFLIPGILRPNTFRDLKSSGIDHLVLSAELLGELQGNWASARPLMSMAENAGVTFTDAHAPFGEYHDINLPFEQFRESMIRQKILSLHICRDFGVNTCTVHTGKCQARTVPVEKYRNFVKDSLEQLLPEAEKCGVVIALENIGTHCDSPEYLIELLEYFNTPFLGLCYDSGHANLMAKGKQFPACSLWEAWAPEIPPWDACLLEKMLPHIVNCHLHDNDGLRDQHYPPFCGNTDWKKITALLEKAPRLLCIQNEASFVNRPTSMEEMVRIYRELFPCCG